MKKKSLIRRLLPWVLLLAVLGGAAVYAFVLWLDKGFRDVL
jgi:hypothetical protein